MAKLKNNNTAIPKLFSKIRSLKVFVVGDVMLDCYWHGSIDRISPEAPVPVVSLNQKYHRVGGAANVALNCKSLGADVYSLSVIGRDAYGNELKKALESQNINTDFLLQSKERPTTVKTRVLAKNQQVLRIDEEETADLSLKDEHHFIDVCLKAIQIEKPDILIFEDYNKGVLTENVIEKIIQHCKHVNVLTAVDPKKKNFFNYKGVDLFKPNLKEIKDALPALEITPNLKSLRQAHTKLSEKLNHQMSLITLSEHGVFVANTDEAHHYKAHKRKIVDVSGAGDTVISVAAIFYKLSNKNLSITAEVANLAGGLVCEEIGVVPISVSRLKEECITLWS